MRIGVNSLYEHLVLVTCHGKYYTAITKISCLTRTFEQILWRFNCLDCHDWLTCNGATSALSFHTRLSTHECPEFGAEGCGYLSSLFVWVFDAEHQKDILPDLSSTLYQDRSEWLCCHGFQQKERHSSQWRQQLADYEKSFCSEGEVQLGSSIAQIYTCIT